jgi:hypothetical protein
MYVSLYNMLNCLQMAHHPAKPVPASDADRKYEEDLERARALSLESLALEKFRLQKLELEKQKSQEQRPSKITEGMEEFN